MKYKRSIIHAAFVVAALAFVGCGKSPANSNMAAKDDPAANYKWNTFADYVGMVHLEDQPPLSDVAEITAALSTAPSNFQPLPNGSNMAQYNAVQAAVTKYVFAEALNMQASKIVSIIPFDRKVLGLNSADNRANDNFISIPFIQRDGTTADLSNVKTTTGIDLDGRFSVNQTVNGAVSKTIAPAKGTIYLMTYLLGSSTQEYQALVSIPDAASSTTPLPLMVFAHGGDAGLTFQEMATLLQGNLGKFIVAAPVYPGEPICAVSFTSGTEENHFTRSCVDENGKVVEPIVKSIGARSPMKGDVNALLALQNGISRLASADLESADNNPFIVNGSSILTLGSTVGIADSRGGGTLMAALGRTGLLLPVVTDCTAHSDIPNYCPLPEDFVLNFKAYFSAAAFYYSPSSFLVGQFRFLTQDMMSGIVPATFNSLPMVPEMTQYFAPYRDTKMGSQEETTELQNLVGFMAASDITYLAPYISVAVQNWNTYFTNPNHMPGSIIFIHGTQDATVPFSESLIAKTALDQVFDNIYRSTASTSPLVAGSVSAVGSQMYSFQPDASYYTAKLGSHGCSDTPDASGNLPVNYNPKTKTCFAGGSDHGMDKSFLTSHLVNYALQKQNINANGNPNSAIKNELLYGVDPFESEYLYSFDVSGSNFAMFLTQLNFVNKALTSLVPGGVEYSIPSQVECADKTLNGACYALGYMSPTAESASYPMYYRSMDQDKTQAYSTALTGVWDSGAQNSLLTPTDLVTSWLNASVLDPLQGVLAQFN